MEDLGLEEALGRYHRVLIREIEFSLKQSSFISGSSWTCDFDIEVSVVILVWLSVNTNNCNTIRNGMFAYLVLELIFVFPIEEI